MSSLSRTKTPPSARMKGKDAPRLILWGGAATLCAFFGVSAVVLPTTPVDATHLGNSIPLPAPGPVVSTASIPNAAEQTPIQIFDNATVRALKQTRSHLNAEIAALREDLQALKDELETLKATTLRTPKPKSDGDKDIAGEASVDALTTGETNIEADAPPQSKRSERGTKIQTLPAPELKEETSELADRAQIAGGSTSQTQYAPRSQVSLPHQNVRVITLPQSREEPSSVGSIAPPSAQTLPDNNSPLTIAVPPQKPTAQTPNAAQKEAGLPANSHLRKLEFSMDLGTFDTPDDAEKAWSSFRERAAGFPPLGSSLTARVKTNPDNTKLSLLAGPFINANDAALACARAMASGQRYCKPELFFGETLALKQ